LQKLQLTSGCEKSTDEGETTTVGGETSSKWPKRPGGEMSRGRNVLGAERPGDETSSEGAKRQRGNTSINCRIDRRMPAMPACISKQHS